MPWQFFILISVFFYSIAIIIQRVLLKESNSRPIAYALVFQVLVSMILAVVALLLGRWQWPDFSVVFPNLVLMTLLYAAANIFIFNALKMIEASKFTILFSIRGFMTVLASTIFLRESLEPMQLIGAVLIFVAIVMVDFKSQHLKFTKGDVFALLGGICFGLANTNDRMILSHMDAYVFTSIGFLTPALVIAALYPKEVPHIKLFLRPSLFKKMMAFASFYAIAAITFFMALQKTTNSSQVASINLTSVILIVLLGVVFLKETDSILKKIAAAMLSFIGLWLING